MVPFSGVVNLGTFGDAEIFNLSRSDLAWESMFYLRPKGRNEAQSCDEGERWEKLKKVGDGEEWCGCAKFRKVSVVAVTTARLYLGAATLR